jgi:hypothetical protein
LLGLSKQAYYKRNIQTVQEELETQIVLEMIKQIRYKMPRLGGRKLLFKLQDKFVHTGTEFGRDSFFNFLRLHGLLVKPRKRYCITTLSAHWLCKYDNLLPGLEIVRINQVWVCDITYIETGEGFLFLYLITDAYSKKIIGYNLSNDLKAISAVVALNMAIKQAHNCESIIHHSDRGIQYGCQEYTAILADKKIRTSMTEPNSPTQNAIAERVNGILKTEWIYETKYFTKKEAKSDIGRIISIYNNERPHSSCSMLTPSEAHQSKKPLRKMWKNYYKKKPGLVGTCEESAVLNVKNQNKKRLPKNRTTPIQHSSQPLIIPSS